MQDDLSTTFPNCSKLASAVQLLIKTQLQFNKKSLYSFVQHESEKKKLSSASFRKSNCITSINVPIVC